MNRLLNYKKFIKNINESVDSDELVGKIDYTLLKPEATEAEIIELCEKAKILGVKSVCVLPKMVKVASESLKESNVLVCTVVSFPQGTNTSEEKLEETSSVINDGADEVDMVLNYPLLKEKGWDAHEELHREIDSLADICHRHRNKNNEKVILKVIVESGLLSDEETEIATEACLDGGADFIKTSTGMISGPGAELNKVKIMRDIITKYGSDMKIKASGGIRTMEDLKNFEPYVDRFGVGFGAVDSIFGNQETGSDGY